MHTIAGEGIHPIDEKRRTASIKIEELKLPEVVLERYRHIILQEQIKASEMDKLIREILEVNNSIHSSNSFL